MAFLQNIFRKLVRNLLPGNSVEKILKVQICESGVMKNAIELWQDMYKNEPPWKGGQEKIIPLNLPAAISSEFARLILTEFRIEISGSQMAEYLDRQLKKDLIDLNKFVEWYCAGGGIAIKPYVAGVNEHGKPTAIKLDFVRSVDFFPCAYDNEMVTAAVFVESKKIGDYLYTRLEYHELSGREYTITNKAFRSEQIYQYDSDGGYSVNDRFQTEVSLSSVPDWAGLSGEPVRIGNVDKPLFVYIKVPVANNIDTSSPLGVSVYSRAVNVIENADRQYGRLLWEYKATEARIMADELGLDPKLARRAGLLHDIGKALDHDVEGTHVQIGVDILKKYKENPLVINAVEAHHGDVEPQTVEAVLVAAADAISASRPGARRETLENYIKRLEKLESIADSFKGVEKSFAIQAGREVRIVVKPEQISDADMTILARDVAKKVEEEMEYPGQIKVNIIRETRVVDYAK